MSEFEPNFVTDAVSTSLVVLEEHWVVTSMPHRFQVSIPEGSTYIPSLDSGGKPVIKADLPFEVIERIIEMRAKQLAQEKSHADTQ